MTSLEQWGIGIQINPPKDEPGNKYILIKEGIGHIEAVELAILTRQHHPSEAVEIWPQDADLRMVVREAAK